MAKIRLPLEMENRKMFLDEEKIDFNKRKLEKFLENEPQVKNDFFAKKVLLSNEVQSNNSVEGYYDDIKKIKEVVLSSKKPKNKKEIDKLRIINLYKGYKYILDEKDINKYTLKKLYSILSDGLIQEYDLKNMGEFYRLKPVYIHNSNNLSKPPAEGVEMGKINYYMDELFSFINSNFNSKCLTDEYIKSQIIHFYFVYIHPYFNINGRCARTIAMWHLLNNKAFPYVIFNRGIEFNKQEYYKVIMDVSKFANISFFVNYMMKTVLIELQKEHVIQNVASDNKDLTGTDYQTLHYLLSMNGILTLCDFANTYNRFNNKKKILEIYSEMIEPLLDKKIIIKQRQTNKKINNDDYNFIFKFNNKFIDDDAIKVEELKVFKNGL